MVSPLDGFIVGLAGSHFIIRNSVLEKAKFTRQHMVNTAASPLLGEQSNLHEVFYEGRMVRHTL